MSLEIQNAVMRADEAKARATENVMKMAAKVATAMAGGGPIGEAAGAGEALIEGTEATTIPEASTAANMIDYTNPKLLTQPMEQPFDNNVQNPPQIPKILQAEAKAEKSLQNEQVAKIRRKRKSVSWKKKFYEMQDIAEEFLDYGAKLEKERGSN